MTKPTQTKYLDSHQRRQHLMLTMLLISAGILILNMVLLAYNSIKQTERQLSEVLLNQKEIIEAVGRFDALHSNQDHTAGSIAATLSQVIDAFARTKNNNTIMSLAEIRDHEIVFIYDQDKEIADNERKSIYQLNEKEWHIPIDNQKTPMRLALENFSGTEILYDYRKILVIAAYTPITINQNSFGLVAKIPLSQALEPFRNTLIVSSLAAIILIVLGTHRFSKLIDPLINELKENRENLKETIATQTSEVKAIVSTAVSGIITINNKGIIRSFNPSAEKIFGYQANEIMDRNVSILIPDVEIARHHDEYIRAFIETGDTKIIGSSREVTAVRKNGELFPIQLAVGHAEPKKGKHLFVGFVTDITRQKQAEKALKDNEYRLKTLLNSITSIIFMKDAKGKYLLINKRYEETLGVTAEQITGKTDDSFMPEDVAQALMEVDQSVINTGTPLKLEEQIIDNNGNLRWYWVEKVPIPDENNRIVGMCGIATDITESKKLQQELKDSEEKFRTLVANIPGISYRCIFNGTRHMEYVSDAVKELTGYPASYFTENDPVSFDEIVFADDRDNVKQTILSAANKNTAYTLEYRILNKNKDLHWVREKGRTHLLDDNNNYMLDGAIFDITDRKISENQLTEAKEKAEIASKTKAAFLANMSHEIRTPMNAVIGFLEIVLETELIEQQRTHLNTALRSAKALLNIINDILDISKIESGKIQLEKVSFNLPLLIQDCLATLSTQAEQKGLHLYSELPTSLAKYFIGDPNRLQQIIINLVGNAIKFTEKGHVSLSVTPSVEKENYLHFIITDTGIGMTKEQMDNIFRPFTQADNSTARRYGGTGLGTTISRQLVELMDGKIWVDSTPKIGSQFHFIVSMPASDEQTETPYKKVDDIFTDHTDSPRSFTVLLAEDIEENATLAMLRLEEQNHQVIWAKNGLEAIAKLEENDIDIVLMDVQMPEMDGLTASKIIREQGNDVPIIALTASVMEDERKSCFDAGMSKIVGKPIDFNELFLAMESYVPTNTNASSLNNNKNKKSKIDLKLLSSVANIEQAISNWLDEELYFKSLNSFLSQRRSSIKELRMALENNNLDEAKNICHALKGVSANLSLKKIHPLTENIETHLFNENLQEAIILLDKLDTEFSRFSILTEEINKSILNSHIQIIEKPDKAYPLLEQLHRALNKDDLNHVEKLLKSLSDFLSPKRLNDINTHVENFDFSDAITACVQLLDTIKSELSTAHQK